jgi:beta-lactamase regulating signal transducer with metallopeptidase domain
MESIVLAVGGTLSGTAHQFAPAFRTFAETAAPLAVTALWQGIAVASALAICLRLAPRMSAAHRFVLWFSGLVALVCLPFLPLLSTLFSAAPSSMPAGLAGAAARPWLQLDIRWSLAVAAIWVAASIVRALDLAVHSLRLRKLWKSAIPIDSEAASLAFPLPGRRMQVCTAPQLERPSVIGFFAPRILIPEWLLTRLTPGELRQIVLHETEHLRRGDDWTNLFQKLCLVLFPLNPALVWMERRLCAEREMACDDGVVRLTHAPRAYAACLASLAERGLRRHAEALSLGAWQRRPELVHRVHSILRRSHALSPAATRTLVGALSCGLIAGSVGLARCPQLVAFVPAQQAQEAQAHSETPHLVQAAYVPLHKSRAVRPSARLRAINVTAALPAVRQSAQTLPRQTASRVKELNTSSNQYASSAPREKMLKAEMPEQNAPQARQPQPQQWIVLATLEQVQTSGRADTSPLENDSDLQADQTATRSDIGPRAKTTAQNSGHPGTQITVTRLIFRVIPLNSRLNQPIPMPVRAGWLVFQL